VQRKTGLQKTIAFRLLKTLAGERFVEQDSETGRFQIGLGAFEVGLAYPEGSSLIGLSRPYLRALVDGSPHTAYLARLDGGDILYLAAIEGTGPLRVHVRPGNRNPAYATAVGKALLAELTDEDVAEIADRFGFVQLTPATITSTESLLRTVREVRQQGYALNSEEAYPGIGAVAAVIRDASGKASAGISMSYATSLLGPDELPAWIERTTATAREISAALGAVPADGRLDA
jgi:IclR family KDG regulon transcriptional repressor